MLDFLRAWVAAPLFLLAYPFYYTAIAFTAAGAFVSEGWQGLRDVIDGGL